MNDVESIATNPTPWYFRDSTVIAFVLGGIVTAGISSVIGIVLLFKKNRKLLDENNGLKEKLFHTDLQSERENILTEIKQLTENADIKKAEIEKELEKEKADLFDELRRLKNNRDAERNMLIAEAASEVQQLNISKNNLLLAITAIEKDLTDKNWELEQKKKDIIITDENILLQEFGLYEPQYDYLDLQSFKDRLKNVRDQQKQAVKSAAEAAKKTTWTVNGKASEGRKMVSDVTKLLIRAFNLECDELIDRVKFNNVDTARQRLEKTFDAINKYGRVLGISLTENYLRFKKEELNLSYEYAVRKQREKEELAEQRARLREEQAAIREIEAMKQKIIKEETHFQQAVEKAKLQLESATDDDTKINLEEKIQELLEKLEALEKDRRDVVNREQNTRAGYVYVISNVGAFGEDVYKIGMTRRLEPLDRVNELGSASVPFKFDVHALIFSEDAPTLESALHNKFENFSLNKMNRRKEFFKVSLEEIEKVVQENHDKEVEFKHLAYADEYRQSLKLLN